MVQKVPIFLGFPKSLQFSPNAKMGIEAQISKSTGYTDFLLEYEMPIHSFIASTPNLCEWVCYWILQVGEWNEECPCVSPGPEKQMPSWG